MSRLIDLAGKTFGRLVVIRREAINDRRGPYWLARCECGTTKTIRGSHLRSAAIKSCGCYSKEKSGERNRTHGLSGNDTHICWKSMWARCRNRNSRDFKNYGARGITVCARWRDFRLFLFDMGLRPPKMTLERIDNNKGYSPDNCRWATKAEQANNTRVVRHITLNGVTLSLSAWDRHLGLPPRCVAKRLRSGWSIEKALSKPARRFNGVRKNVRRAG